jgi:hypothetical protein
MRILRFYIGVIKKMSAGLLPAFLVLLTLSCQKKEVNLTPTCSTNPTATVSFKRDVFPIIKTNCLSCHDESNHYGGIILDSYEKLQLYGKSDDLVNSINIASNGKAYMPKGGRLLDCEIVLIQAWVKQGVANN